jgi:hypothetical protein
VSSPVKRELEEYLAGRGTPERVVIAVTVAYYREGRGGQRETLRPLINVIDRASPGIVELGSLVGGRGFEVRLAERPFPPQYEEALREAVQQVLRDAALAPAAEPPQHWVRIEPPPPAPPSASPGRHAGAESVGLWRRMVGALRRLLSG